MSKAKKDDKVKVHYTGKLDNGQVFDTSENREPLEFVLGEGKLIPGFEDAVVGMELNETRTAKIPVTDAYGERRADLLQEVPKSMLPPDLDPKVGMQLATKQQDGQQMVVHVAEIKDESIVIDANHPLAGENLTFDIKLVEIV